MMSNAMPEEVTWGSDLDTQTGNDNIDPQEELAAHPYGLSAPLAEYAAGILIPSPGTMGFEADAYPPPAHPLGIPLEAVGTRLVDKPYQTPHEATHRRYEPPVVVNVNQAAAGYTLLAAPNQGLHYIKVLACFITLDAAGTIRFVQGGLQTASDPGLTGNINLGGASAPALQLPPAPPENPWLFTSPDQALGIVTATGKAQGWLLVCYSPFDS